MIIGLSFTRLYIHPTSQSGSWKQSRWCFQPPYIHSDKDVNWGSGFERL